MNRKILLANPRGFCAGVDRAIDIVEKAIESIKNAAYSGRIGDGKIFVSNIEQAIRIRTGEKGSDAV